MPLDLSKKVEERNNINQKFWPVVAFLLGFYSLISFFVLQDHINGWLQLINFVIVSTLMPISIKIKNALLTENIMPPIVIISLIAWLFTGGPAGVGFWASILHVIGAFLASSKRWAFIWITVHLLASSIIVALAQFGVFTIAYSLPVLANVLIVYLAAVYLIYSFVGVRDKALILSEQRREALDESNEKFYKIFDEIGLPIVISKLEDGKIIEANSQFIKLFGFNNKEEVIGKSGAELNIIDTKTRAIIIEEVKQKGSLTNKEFILKKKDGSEFWSLHTVKPILLFNQKHLLILNVDIDERKKMEEQISKLSDFQNIILNGTDYSIITTSAANGLITSFNKGAEEMLGYKANEVIGVIHPNIILDENDVSINANEIARELNLSKKTSLEILYAKADLSFDVNHYEANYIHKDGTKIKVELSISALRDQSKAVVGYLNVAKNITEIKRAEEALVKAKEAAEQTNILKETFLANMSHEIRTPMNAIIGFTDLLLKKDLTNQEKDYVNIIKTSGENLLRIINDILDVSKIESGVIIFEDYPTNFKEIFKTLHNLLIKKAKEKNLNLSFEFDENLPETVLADPTRLTQIILNLVGNAIKFTKTGGITVFVKTKREENDKYFIEFLIKDTGIGISEDKLQQIFERFVQAEAHTTRNYGGTGLGLSIAKQLIELQGGLITVESVVGVGTTFAFTMPFKKSNKSNSLMRNESHTQNIEKLREKKILLVEDNAINIKFILSLFSDYDLKVDVAENGISAIEKIKHAHFDIILMDIEMPEMNGYEATTIIRQELNLTIPIIAMTAHAMSGEKEKCISLGMNDYISKPINVEFLFEKMLSETTYSPISLHDSNKKLVNLDYLTSSMHGKKEVILEVINIFLELVPDDLLIINEAINKTDYITVKNKAHKMKSTFSVMGVFELESILSELELIEISDIKIDRIHQLNQSLNIKCAQALEEVKLERLNYL